MWPGIALTMEQGGAIRPLPNRWVRSWITALHGFEAKHLPIGEALNCAARLLRAGHEREAQTALDLVGLDRLSPEGAALARAMAAKLGTAPPSLPVGTKSLPWGNGNHVSYVELFCRFGGAAAALEKDWDPDKHPRWPKETPDRQGGRFAPSNTPSAPTVTPVNAQEVGIGHNGGPPLEDMPEIPEEAPRPSYESSSSRTLPDGC
jgi:hypothetical protein